MKQAEKIYKNWFSKIDDEKVLWIIKDFMEGLLENFNASKQTDYRALALPDLENETDEIDINTFKNNYGIIGVAKADQAVGFLVKEMKKLDMPYVLISTSESFAPLQYDEEMSLLIPSYDVLQYKFWSRFTILTNLLTEPAISVANNLDIQLRHYYLEKFGSIDLTSSYPELSYELDIQDIRDRGLNGVPFYFDRYLSNFSPDVENISYKKFKVISNDPGLIAEIENIGCNDFIN